MLLTGSLGEAAAAARARVSIPSIISYVGGGAVGGGVNHVLGGSNAAGVASSIISDIECRNH